MRKFILTIIFICIASISFAAEHVNGYYRKDGTYVQPHWRSDSNGTPTDNYTFKGNTNPWTGKEGHDYYRSDPKSPYYSGYSSGKGLFDK
jgi:hypothetical protein